MRLKSSIWVAAYLRRCQTEGIFGAVRRRGAEEAGAVFVKVALLDGNAMLYAPAPQTVYDESRPAERLFAPASPQPVPEQSVEERLAKEIRFDPDAWIVETEDRAGRHFLDLAKALASPNRRCRCALAERCRAVPRDASAAAPTRARLRSSSYSDGAIFGAGDRHGRAAPCRQHDQRRSLGQPIVEPRQPVDIVHRGAEFGIEEQQHPLERRARHVERPRCAGQRLAAGIVDDLRRRSAPAGSALRRFRARSFRCLRQTRPSPASRSRAWRGRRESGLKPSAAFR